MSLKRLTRVSFLLAVSPLVFGFEGHEHRELSELALSIAVDLRCPASDPPDTGKCGEVRKAWKKLTAAADDDLSYGKINQVVDYMHYPEMVFVTGPYWRTEKMLNEHVSELLTRNLDRFALFDYLSASSHNERHFQFDMMKSMDMLHRSAIGEARDGRIFHALVYNALSDHYLNDFFAPGHVTTQRENSHDMVSLAMHDWSNRAGACFEITRWEEFEEVLDFLVDQEHELVAEIGEDVELANRNLKECGNTSVFSVEGLSREKLQDATIASLRESHDTVYLKGDGRLLRNPRQKLFILLVQVRSIAEVIESYLDCEGTPACGDPLQAVTHYGWSNSFNKKEVLAPQASIRYGNYNINNREEIPVRTLGIPVGKRPRYAYPVIADNGFLLSIGGQVLEHEPARIEAQFELFPMKIGSAWPTWRNVMAPRPSSQCDVGGGMFCNVGLAYGITYFRSADLDGMGGQIRIIKAWPKISGHLSVILRRSRYDYTIDNSWENSYGLRYDHGFSLHSFYIGVQRDWGLDSSGGFGHENLITFGWNLTFPSSRFLGIFGGYK